MNRVLHKIVARFRIDPVGVAMPGARLPQRIRSIIGERLLTRISRTHAVVLIGTCATICAASLVVTVTRGQTSDMQAWEKTAGGAMSFDVASVKQNTDTGNFTRPTFTLDDSDSYPGNTTLFSATVTVSRAIAFAYKLSQYQSQVMEAHLPKWATSERFDIQARAPSPSTKDQMRLMMQSLLTDRFKLTTHFETNVKPIFALVLAKAGQAGPQLRHYEEDPPCNAAPPGPGAPALKTTVGQFPPMCYLTMGIRTRSSLTWGARKVTLQQIAKAMSSAPMANLDRPVVDRTGLTGTFDFLMNYVVPSPEAPNAAVPDSGAGTFIEALKEQLGLKLDSSTGPVESLVVDHIEEPTPN